VDSGRWQRVKDLFAAALEQDAAGRDGFLDSACAGEPELRAEVDSLLAAHASTDDFIERPAAHRALDLEPETPPPSWIGRRVGDYRIVEEVGRGGMSEVYKGVRDDDEYQKEVAIKVLRQGYGTKSLLKRFKVETQILASLDHPNIARLLDGDTTDDGLPYFVMEYVEGLPIDQYCERQALDITQRLQLFRQVCAAVSYAHRRAVIHRDLKTSNILVTSDGTPKLLDFGIARLLEAPDVPAAPATMLEQRVMTPDYASPEQLRGEPVTTASDVYSLGVVLYRLLTGQPPYRLKTRTPEEMERTVGKTEMPMLMLQRSGWPSIWSSSPIVWRI